LRQTGNDFDLAVDGQGLFILRDKEGNLTYTRAGLFAFDDDGFLVNPGNAARVMARGQGGTLTDINISALRLDPPKATGTVVFAGNLSSTEVNKIVNGVKVIDAAGAEHQLSITFTSQSDVQAGRWKLTLHDGATEVGTATMDFVDGKPTPETAKPSFRYTPAGKPEMTVVMDFSGQITSFASGTLSTLAVSSQDGFLSGTISKLGIDDSGVLQFEYANGNKAQGSQLALARFDSPELLTAVGGNAFKASEGASISRGRR